MGETPMLTVNGEARPFRDQTVEALAAEVGLDPGRRGAAVAVNGRVVPRTEWARTRLSPGDAVEIVRPLAGG